jgi:endonuclease YncB( thermonuclease family)
MFNLLKGEKMEGHQRSANTEGKLIITCSLKDSQQLCAVLVDSGYIVEVAKVADGDTVVYLGMEQHPYPTFELRYRPRVRE